MADWFYLEKFPVRRPKSRLPEIIFREIRIIGSVGATRRHVEEAARLVADGKIRPVISRILPWNQWETAITTMTQRSNIGRVVLDFTQAI